MISIFYNNKYSRVEKRIGVRIQKQPPKKKERTRRNGFSAKTKAQTKLIVARIINLAFPLFLNGLIFFVSFFFMCRFVFDRQSMNINLDYKEKKK